MPVRAVGSIVIRSNFSWARLFVALACWALLASAAGAAGGPVRRTTLCGWFENPTPGNAWLVDRTGEWAIGTQGGHQADGDWPDFKPSQWVVTNSGSHGYGCACMTGEVDMKSREVLRIVSARAKPLIVCRKDRTLKAPLE